MARHPKRPADPARRTALTPSQRAFVDEYLVDLNGTRAYRAAYPRTTYQAAAVQAHRLLKDPNVRAEVEAALRAQRRRARLSADKVLRELARVAFSDIADLFDADGNLHEPHDLPLETRRAIAAVKVTQERITRRVVRDGETTVTETVRTRVVEIRLADKLAALGRLSKYLGLGAPLPPLEAMLAAFPPPVAEQIRDAMADGKAGEAA